jgi:hypothetical protein
MALLQPDPVTAHSLWLQLRSSKRKHRPRWRSGWAPLWVPFLLLGLLALFYAIMPPNQAIDNLEQAVQMETGLQASPVLGSLASP